MSRTVVTQTEQAIIFRRLFAAPRELVFEAFSKPKHLLKWWGPKYSPLLTCTVDFRPGGKWHYSMPDTDGTVAWVTAVYQEIIRPEKIVYRDGFSGPDQNSAITKPLSLTTITFVENGKQTEVTSHVQYPTAALRQEVAAIGIVEGFSQALDFLDVMLHEISKKG